MILLYIGCCVSRGKGFCVGRLFLVVAVVNGGPNMLIVRFRYFCKGFWGNNCLGLIRTMLLLGLIFLRISKLLKGKNTFIVENSRVLNNSDQ